MPTTANVSAPYTDWRKSGSNTGITFDGAASPSPKTVVPAAAVMHADATSDNYNRKNRSIVNVVLLSESDIKKLIVALYNENQRAEALDILARVVNYRPVRTLDLAPMLWNTTGIVFILLQEALAAYTILNKEDQLRLIVDRVVDAICLLQCIAMHSSFKKAFVTAHIPFYFYPFLRIRESTPTIEKLRLASLGALGGLVKTDSSEVIHYLLDSEAFPCCLCSLEFGNELSKSVAAFVMSKLLSTNLGISYCCNIPERFLAVLQVFQKTVEQTSHLSESTVRMLRCVVGSYLVLAEFPRSCEYIKLYFPLNFCNGHFLRKLGQAEPGLYENIKRLCDKIEA